MILSGAVVAAGVSQGRSTSLKRDFKVSVLFDHYAFMPSTARGGGTMFFGFPSVCFTCVTCAPFFLMWLLEKKLCRQMSTLTLGWTDMTLGGKCHSNQSLKLATHQWYIKTNREIKL